MGVFDVRCAVSGLSTSFARGDEGSERSCSMMLLERVGDQWLPLTPFVSGIYDSYGRLEVWPRWVTPHVSRVGERLDALHAAGRFVISEPAYFERVAHTRTQFLDGARTLPPRIVPWLAVASSIGHTGLRLGNHEVKTCLVLDDAVDALLLSLALRETDAREVELRRSSDAAARAVLIDWLEERGRVSLASYLRAQSHRGPWGELGPAHPSVDLARESALVEWLVESPRGLKPLDHDDCGTWSEDEALNFALEAANREATFEQLVASRCPEAVEQWRAEGRIRRVERALRKGAPYRATERYAPGQLVEHPTFGTGLVEALKPPNKVVIAFGLVRRVLVHRKEA